MIRPTVVESMNLTERSKAAVKALLSSPLAAKALAEQEVANLDKRRQLREAAARAGAPHQRPLKSAADAHAEAVQRREAAQAALQAAFIDEREAWAKRLAAESLALRAAAAIEGDLLETADPRIGTFDFVLELLDDAARAALTFYPNIDPTITAKQSELVWNTKEVQAARLALRECRDECVQLRREVITHADLTARFDAMCERLVSPLAALELNPPQIDAEGAIGRWLRWEMRPMSWRVETLWNEPRQPEPIVDKAGKKVPLA